MKQEDINRSVNRYIERERKIYKQRLERVAEDRATQKTPFKERFSSGFNLTLNILTIFLICLLLVMLIRTFQNSSIPTFRSLLDVFSKVSAPNIPFINFNKITLGDWGNLFNPLRDFIYFQLELINVLVFFANGIINCITYIVYFMRWMFGI